jgi:hypothetical protein
LKEKISYQDKITGKALFGTVKKVNTIMTNRWRSSHADQMYRKPSTKNLFLIRKGGIGCSNNYFNNCKSNINDGLMRYIVKSRAGVIWDAHQKHRYLGEGDSLCSCGKIGNFNHLMNNCLQQGTRMTKRHDAIVDIVGQAAQLHKIRNDEDEEIDDTKYILGKNTAIQLPKNISNRHTWKEEELEIFK